MSVSVIISNFNGAKYLPKLLSTLGSQEGVELDVIVVDRQSKDESHTILAAHPEVRVITEPPESGLVSGYSAGVKLARHDMLFFCNEDMWFDPNCLQLLAERIDLTNGVAAANPWQWTYDGAVPIHRGTRFRTVRIDLSCPHPRRQLVFDEELPAGAEIAWGCAGAVLIHRAVYESLGGWDQTFFLDYEDVDLFLRAWQQRWKCATVPAAKVYHALSVSNVQMIAGGRQRVGRRRYIAARANLLTVALKHFTPRFALWALAVWTAAGLNKLRHRYYREAWLYVLAAREVGQRLRGILAYRRAAQAARAARPGEAYFEVPQFQYGAPPTIIGPRSEPGERAVEGAIDS